MIIRRATAFAGVLAMTCCASPDPAERAPPVITPRASVPLPPTEFVLDGAAVQGGVVRGRAPAGTAGLTLDGAPVALASDGAFLIAFDRDAVGSASLSARRFDGTNVTRTLSVAPGSWRIERVNANPRGSASDAEFERRRPAELARIEAARSRSSAAQGWRQTFIWPAQGRISGVFGSQRIYRGVPGSYHSGTDVAGATGTPFRAPADGIVVLAAQDPFTLEGRVLIIDHGNGLNSAFLHALKLYVGEGDSIRQGQALGEIGATGRTTGPHLHWGMKWNMARIDPQKLAGPMR